MKRVIAAFAVSLFVAPAFAAGTDPVPADIPGGTYTIDKPHTSLIFRVDHLGFSHFTARFTDIDAKLQIDPKHPQQAKLDVTIDPKSIASDNAPAGFLDMLRGAQWLKVASFPKITYHATKIDMTGPRTARITGDLSLHGETHPVVLDATFNGGYAGHPLDPHARIGFSAHGSFNRSQFGMGFGVPAPGSTMGVGDKVEMTIETEFNGPAMASANAKSDKTP